MRKHLNSCALKRGFRPPCVSLRHWISVLHLLVGTILLFGRSACGGESATDRWYIIRFNDKPVGSERVRVQPIEFEGQTLLACFRKTQMSFKRLGTDLTVRASLWTRQDTDGTLHYFNLQRVDGAGARLERTGTWNRKRSVFKINERVAATRREFQLRMSGPVRSPLMSTWLPDALESKRNGLTVDVLFPESANVAKVFASQRRNKQVRIDSIKRIDAGQITFAPQLEPGKRTTLLIDANNSLLRSEHSILGGTLTLQTSSPEAALSESASRSLNLDLLATVPVTSLLTSSANRKNLVIELSVMEGFLPEIPETDFQKVESLNSMTARLTLTKPDLKNRSATRHVSYSKHPATVSTRWMPLHDARLQRMAATGAAGATHPTEVCLRLERFVQAKMKNSAFSTSIVPADEVARLLRGDCTEHAVFLAALMRIKGIPSRVASGLVHSNQQFGFVGHMWVEAFIEDQWLPFDSASSGASADLTHIKLAHSELTDSTVSGILLFLPLLDLAGQAQVSVISNR